MKNNHVGPLFIFLVFLATAECVLGLAKQFHFVAEAKSWWNARDYCRTRYTDLATVRSQKENEQLLSVFSFPSGKFFLGLYRDPDDDTAWRWTEGLDYPVNSSEYTNWFDLFQPLPKSCTCMPLHPHKSRYRTWRSEVCLETRLSLCGNSDGTFQLVREGKTWLEAQQYCEKNHQSLATITDPNKVTASAYHCVWIGLFRDVDAEWKWVGEKQSDLRNWAKGQPRDGNCGMISSASSASTFKWHSLWCGHKLYFFCYDETLMLVRQKKTWEEALDFCRALGKKHAVPHSYDLASLASADVHLYAQEKISAATTDQVWTGLRLLAGRWLWVSGEQLQHQDLPVCPATGWRCGSLPTDSTRRWEVRDCMEKKNFLCMRTT